MSGIIQARSRIKIDIPPVGDVGDVIIEGKRTVGFINET
jgi:hypothetical protein